MPRVAKKKSILSVRVIEFYGPQKYYDTVRLFQVTQNLHGSHHKHCRRRWKYYSAVWHTIGK